MGSDISVVLITNNESSNVKECLKPFLGEAEVVVVDGFSSDGTGEVSRQLGCDVYERELDNFAGQKNFGIGKAKRKWVLVIDADERVGKDLWNEIKMVTKEDNNNNGYYVPFKNIFIDKPLRFGGWYPDYHLRLAKKDKCKMVGEVHEVIEVEGKAGYLKNPIVHHMDKDLKTRIRKTNVYTSMDSKREFTAGRKFHIWGVVMVPLWIFIKRYFAMGGFRDGVHGYIRAVLLSFTYFIKHAKLWEFYRKK